MAPKKPKKTDEPQAEPYDLTYANVVESVKGFAAETIDAGAAVKRAEAGIVNAIDPTLGQAGLGLMQGYPPHDPASIQTVDYGRALGAAGEVGRVTAGPNVGAVNHARRKPTIGRVVHFSQEGSSELMAAMVTGVYDATTVDLAVFPPGRPATFAIRVVEGEPGISGRCWSWPAMV